jgi:arabinose-5-phosphate isomerase
MTIVQDTTHWFAEAQRVLDEEASAIRIAADRLDEATIAAAVSLIVSCTGRVVVTGMGKSGAVGRKFASTLASTGTPALFLHPAEGVHGDLGMIADDDVVISFSYSGETDELLAILPAIDRIGVPIISFTGKKYSTLGKSAKVVIDCYVDKEACLLNLAPTTSTTVMLALSDALAIAVMDARRFTAEQYASRHPAGSLGRRLLLRVVDVMRKGDAVAIVPATTLLRDTLFAITKAHAGAAIVVDEAGLVSGFVTDGDVRRHLLDSVDCLARPVSETMNPKPGVIPDNVLAVDGLDLLASFHPDPGARAGEAPVVDADGKPVGMLMLKDLVKAGIV